MRSKIKFHCANLLKTKHPEFAITPCLYTRVDRIVGVRSFSLIFAWLFIQTSIQFMWIVDE